MIKDKKTRKENEHKILLREKDQEIKAHKQSQLALVEAIKSTAAESPPKEGQEYEDAAAKVCRLSRIDVEIKG